MQKTISTNVVLNYLVQFPSVECHVNVSCPNPHYHDYVHHGTSGADPRFVVRGLSTLWGGTNSFYYIYWNIVKILSNQRPPCPLYPPLNCFVWSDTVRESFSWLLLAPNLQNLNNWIFENKVLASGNEQFCNICVRSHSKNQHAPKNGHHSCIYPIIFLQRNGWEKYIWTIKLKTVK